MCRKRCFNLPLLFVLFVVAAPAVEAAKTRVLFISNPPGSTVVDANLGELGVTPLRLELKRKTELECTFSKKGYETRTVTYTVDGLKMDVRADLPALPLTTVRLGIEPRQASVRLSSPDGSQIYTGESNRVHTLPKGFWGTHDTAEFHVEAWATGHRPLDAEIVLTQHEYHDLRFELEEVSTMLSVTSEPEGVYVKDLFLGALGTTPFEARVSLVDLMRARSRKNTASGDPGRLVLTFTKSGYLARTSELPLDFDRDENSLSMVLKPRSEPAGH